MSLKLKIPQATKTGFIEVVPNGAFDFAYPTSLTRRGRVQGGGNISPTITCVGAEFIYLYECRDMATQEKKKCPRVYGFYEMEPDEKALANKPKGRGWRYVMAEKGPAWVRIRKLTPRECFRLMNVDEDKIDRLLNAGISDSQLYKLAGNSIVVSCMEGIFYNAFCEDAKEPAYGQLSLF